MKEAQRLYSEGQVLYSAADYLGAIDKFTEALAIATRDAGAFDPEVRGRLLYNLATAHDRAFNTERDDKHLRIARELYGRIIDEAAVLGYSDSLVQQATEARHKVDTRLQEYETASQPQPTPAPQPEPPPPEPEPEPEPPRRPGRALTFAGAGVAGLGVAASGLWIAGLVGASRATDDVTAASTIDQETARIDALDRGARSNALLIAGGAVSGVLVAGGVAMIIAGQIIGKRQPGGTACTPAAGRQWAGVGCRLRF
ncbi:MAG: hypothetical protein AAGF11_22900 [Myxococcota bacterium]